MYPHTFGHPDVWMPFIYLDASPVCLDAPHVWTTSCMFGCPICLDTPQYVGHPYVWMLPECVDAPICFDTLICLDGPICLEDVWMPAVHIQHKESMLCQTEGVSIWPNTLGHPQCLDALHLFGCTPSMFGYPHMFGHPTYIWMHTVCLDLPHMFGCSPVCFDDFWMPPVHTQHKRSMLCQTKGVFLCPHTFGCPHIFRCPCIFGHLTYVWMSLIPLDATIHLATSKHTVGQPNIWRASKHMLASKHTGGIQMYRTYGHPLV